MLPRHAPRDLGATDSLTITPSGDGIVHSVVRARVAPDGRAHITPAPRAASSVRVRSQDPSIAVVSARHRPPAPLAKLLPSLVGLTVEIQTSADDVSRERWRKAQVVAAGDTSALVRFEGEAGTASVALPPGGLRLPAGAAAAAIDAEFQVDVRAVGQQQQSAAPEERQFELSYLTGPFSWRAEYTAILDPTTSMVQLDGVFAVRNNSGRDFERVQLSLQESGSAFSLPSGSTPPLRDSGDSLSPVLAAQQPQPPTAWAHTLGNPRVHVLPTLVPLPDGRTTRVGMCSVTAFARVFLLCRVPGQPLCEHPPDPVLEKSAVPSELTYPVLRIMQFNNSSSPLAQGTANMLVRQSVAGGALGLEPFARDVAVAACAPGRPIRLKHPVDVPIMATRRRTEFKVDRFQRVLVESFEIVLTRTGPADDDTAVDTIVVEEDMPRWCTWTVSSSNVPRERPSDFTATFTLELQPNPKATCVLTYTAVYTAWSAPDEQSQAQAQSQTLLAPDTQSQLSGSPSSSLTAPSLMRRLSMKRVK
eukprot:m51a1_g770 hypothetical protein (532) ;mRNA; f:575132-576853